MVLVQDNKVGSDQVNKGHYVQFNKAANYFVRIVKVVPHLLCVISWPSQLVTISN